MRDRVETVTYGASFSRHHAQELGLDWKEVYLAILDELKVRHLRLSAHWYSVEPRQDVFDFSGLDYELAEAQRRGAKVILAVGRRLPGWPECHDPDWSMNLDTNSKRKEILELVQAIVNRYKGRPSVEYWQVENEPFLTLFARHKCGDLLDANFLKDEIALVKKLDPTRKVIITDSGELSLWYKAYRNADIFGTSMYLYVWSHRLGSIKYPITPSFFIIKKKLVKSVLGDKKMILSELSAEPWLPRPIVETPIDQQLKFMNIDRLNRTVEFARNSGFETQYLWGAEWWYWLRKNGHDEFWERGLEIFDQNN